MLNEILNNICSFLVINRTLFDNVLTTIIYGLFVLFSVKRSSNWITMLIGYIFLSAVLTFLGISSYLNIINLITNLFRDFFNSLFDGFWGRTPSSIPCLPYDECYSGPY